MKITPKILSIPPYLSTTWKNIASLQAKPTGNVFTLQVLLQNQKTVEVPGLNQEMIDEIFASHARFADPSKLEIDPSFGFSLPIQGEGGVDALNPALHHNPEQANLPPLQPEVLRKIAAIAKIIGAESFSFLKAEPNCNCLHCQISRAFQQEEEFEEVVSDEDLRFRDWDITQTGDKLYQVVNPLDSAEHYNVFLGKPIGCTCGSKDCEHIRAVLKS